MLELRGHNTRLNINKKSKIFIIKNLEINNNEFVYGDNKFTNK